MSNTRSTSCGCLALLGGVLPGLALSLALVLGGCCGNDLKDSPPARSSRALRARRARRRAGDGRQVDQAFEKLAGSIARSLTDQKRSRVAVLDFTIERSARSDAFGKLAAEMFETAISKSGRFRLLERKQLMRLLRERNIEFSDFFDQDKVTRIGTLEGVHDFVYGTVWDFGPDVKVIVKVIDIRSGELVVQDSARIAKASLPARYRPFSGTAATPSAPEVPHREDSATEADRRRRGLPTLACIKAKLIGSTVEEPARLLGRASWDVKDLDEFYSFEILSEKLGERSQWGDWSDWNGLAAVVFKRANEPYPRAKVVVDLWCRVGDEGCRQCRFGYPAKSIQPCTEVPCD